MPPKAKITRDMVIDAAFEVARETGVESINARTVSAKLNCSTQPVMYHFATIEELKKTVYAKADSYHSAYLMNTQKPQTDILLQTGLNYIRFAIEEPHLFRFLFQSDYFSGVTLTELADAEELMPVLSAMQRTIGGSMAQIKEIFTMIWLFAHGYAAMTANNSLEYNGELIQTYLERAYKGAVSAVLGETK